MDIRQFSSALLPLVMLLQACSSTPFGQQLSDSFDGQDAADLPTAAGSQAAASQVAASQPQQAETKDTKETKDDRADRAAEQETPQDQTSAERQQNSSDKPVPTADVQPKDLQPATARAVPERTRPYRITIRLSAADPAAPAEGVTEALRRAGIGFEVETIEKVPARELNQSSSIQPSSTQRQPAS